MSLSNITKSEIEQWESASGEYKGVSVYVTRNQYGLYTASLNIMFAEEGEHDGHIIIGTESEASISELKRSIKEEVNYFIKQHGSVKSLAKKARDFDFRSGSVRELNQL